MRCLEIQDGVTQIVSHLPECRVSEKALKIDRTRAATEHVGRKGTPERVRSQSETNIFRTPRCDRPEGCPRGRVPVDGEPECVRRWFTGRSQR